MKTKRNIPCKTVVKFLTAIDDKNITDAMNQGIETHLQECEHCQNFQKNLIKIQQQLKTQQLTPDPTIRKTMLNHLKTLHPHRFTRLIQRIHDMLDYRIPVYQAVVTTISILLLIFMIDRLFLEKNIITKIAEPALKIESSTFEHMDIVNIQNIVERQKIGRNVKEDSVLARYIYQIGH